MKIVNLNTNAVLALVTAIVIAISVPANAEENGFTLEDSIRNQIFMELKSNVRHLYLSGDLLVPSVDTSIAARVVSTDANSNLILPANFKSNEIEKDETVDNIN